MGHAIRVIFLLGGMLHCDSCYMPCVGRTGATIHCSVPSKQIRLFMLKCFKKTFRRVSVFIDNERNVWECTVNPNTYGSGPRTFYVDIYTRNPVIELADFDVDLITASSTDLMCADAVIHRIQQRRFAAFKSVPDACLFRQVMRAKALIDLGWVMDDCCIGESAWLLGKWFHLFNLRTHCTLQQRIQIIQHSKCLSCGVGFELHDDVLNLQSLQNIHYECYICWCGTLEDSG